VNLESAENVRSSNVVEFEFRHIPNHILSMNYDTANNHNVNEV